jgi:hypothetical protein
MYPEEVEMKLKMGGEEIERLFERHKVSEIVDSKWCDVSRKDWWRLWVRKSICFGPA